MALYTLTQPRLFRGIREVSLVLLIAAPALDVLFTRIYLRFLQDPLNLLQNATRGILSPLLVLNALKLLFVVVGLIIWICRLRKKDLGLQKANLHPALLFVPSLWFAMQGILALMALSRPEGVRIMQDWYQLGPLPLIADFTAMLLGTALFTEITYRGFLLPQVYLKLERYVRLPSREILLIALVLSVALYVVLLVPAWIQTHVIGVHLAGNAASAMLIGLVNAMLYLRTNNLYLNVGLFAIWHRPLLVVEPIIPYQFILLPLICILIVVWPYLPNSDAPERTWPLD
jgi:hypothetical protein